MMVDRLSPFDARPCCDMWDWFIGQFDSSIVHDLSFYTQVAPPPEKPNVLVRPKRPSSDKQKLGRKKVAMFTSTYVWSS